MARIKHYNHKTNKWEYADSNFTAGGNIDYYEQPEAPDDAPVGSLWYDTDEMPPEESGGIYVTGATVGQTVKISAVDENGVPTAWESVDFPSGGGGEKVWRKLKTITFSEDVSGVNITEDDDGNPFSVSELIIYICALKTGIDCGCGIRINNTLVCNVPDIFQDSYAQMYVRTHIYHDGLGYCTEKINNYSASTNASNIWRHPIVVNETAKQDITNIRMQSLHSSGVFVANSKIEIWGVDA